MKKITLLLLTVLGVFMSAVPALAQPESAAAAANNTVGLKALAAGIGFRDCGGWRRARTGTNRRGRLRGCSPKSGGRSKDSDHDDSGPGPDRISGPLCSG